MRLVSGEKDDKQRFREAGRMRDSERLRERLTSELPEDFWY